MNCYHMVMSWSLFYLVRYYFKLIICWMYNNVWSINRTKRGASTCGHSVGCSSCYTGYIAAGFGILLCRMEISQVCISHRHLCVTLSSSSYCQVQSCDRSCTIFQKVDAKIIFEVLPESASWRLRIRTCHSWKSKSFFADITSLDSTG